MPMFDIWVDGRDLFRTVRRRKAMLVAGYDILTRASGDRDREVCVRKMGEREYE